MGNVERVQGLGAATERTTRQRNVPSDWFLDPADPGAADRYDSGRALDDAATAFLEAHDGRAELAPVTPLPVSRDAEMLAEGLPEPEESESQQVWISLGTFLAEEDEGELGWQTEALCAQTDPEAFFPEKGGSTRDAKKVCSGCTVRSECLGYALQNDERFGIWGGLSERERRRLRKRAN